MPLFPADMDKCRANDVRKQELLKALRDEQEAVGARAQAEHQRFADSFAKQQGIDPSKVTMHICRRGAIMSIEAAYRCVNGHDRCYETSPGPHCQYCERV